MAAPTTFKFGAGYIELGDGGGTEVFTKICGFTQIEVSFEKDLNDTTVPDCDDPDAPAWTERDVSALSASFKASGVLAKAALPLVEAGFLADNSRNVKIRLIGGGTGSGTPDRLISGKFHVKHSLKSQRGNKWEIDFSGESDGVVAMTNVAAV